ncbi:YccT family protein [Vibrio genomosp. F10]|uniref:DUF2057 domain-containing protein n=3 Tax=Vibrio genomosp. F10 TaxID=723171 RepID=A0A1B9QZ01_9VIBR|nr:DUF2057 domain-containing protein [Vibrio genomosp. F10]OCH76198.1 hypothetical protein A6E14_09670 [Vibrio genomosp. F10]OEE31812.1 hypothetical protein A1QO_13005 [Vibrio genomosp. F10 str. ZF-129]OEE93122.1 hypothetical protein A1QM_10490 [Vibrio genomosp. F10 str. 9ZC157]
MKKLAILSLALFSTFSYAKTTIQTDSRVEILAVNQEINQIANSGKGDLKIENGQNQLLVRVTAMIDTNGGKEKFNSSPLVVTFDSADQTLLLETPFAIRDERAVNKYNRAPSVKVTSAGKDVPVSTDVITNETFALIKDYDAMLSSYNQAGGKAAIASTSVAAASIAKPVTLPEIESPKKQTKPVSKPSSLQADFLAMTPEQRQEFVSWAVKNLNN